MLSGSQEMDAKSELDQAMAGLSPKSQRRVAKKLYKKYGDRLSDLKEKKTLKRYELDCIQSVLSWLQDNENPILEKNQCSRLHKLVDAVENERLITNEGIEKDYPESGFQHIKNTFVVKHDWAAALGSLEGGEIKLPYDIMAFEFMICGKAVIAPAIETDKIRFTVFAQTGEYWAVIGTNYDDRELARSDSLIWFVWDQIQAICIALDAEVACDEVIRAPHKLNQKRVKAGKKPLADFHVVDLAKRHRVSNPSHGESGTKVRLHFRRGHWRHYEDTKTWIKWCLVGDPDLGFITKHYSI